MLEIFCSEMIGKKADLEKEQISRRAIKQVLV